MKMKKKIIFDESTIFHEPTEFEKRLTSKKGNDGQMILVKSKKVKLKKKRTLAESIGAHDAISELEIKPNFQKEKDGVRPCLKAKKMKLKEKLVSDESIAFHEPPVFKNRSSSHKGNDREGLYVKVKKRTLKKNRALTESIGTGDSLSELEMEPKIQKVLTGKLVKNCKMKMGDSTNVKESIIVESIDKETVYEISSGDDDCSKGMKKWLKQYSENRPGLEVLQQRIDDFVAAHEEQQKQEKKEREARAAEDGWTVVVHHKGRKKTTDAETGTAIGSVASAAVIDKMSKKKGKDIALDFYRFQKREAKRNELMMLQSKFEQDKKRIQQLRAARKFRPY